MIVVLLGGRLANCCGVIIIIKKLNALITCFATGEGKCPYPSALNAQSHHLTQPPIKIQKRRAHLLKKIDGRQIKRMLMGQGKSQRFRNPFRPSILLQSLYKAFPPSIVPIHQTIYFNLPRPFLPLTVHNTLAQKVSHYSDAPICWLSSDFRNSNNLYNYVKSKIRKRNSPVRAWKGSFPEHQGLPYWWIAKRVSNLSTLNLSIKSKIIIITPIQGLPLQSQPPRVQLHYLPQQRGELALRGLQFDRDSDSGILLQDGRLLDSKDGRSFLGDFGLYLLVLLAEDASLLPVVLDDELGGGVGDGQLSGSLVDRIFLVLHHLDQPQPLLSRPSRTLKEILEYCALGLAQSSFSAINSPILNLSLKFQHRALTPPRNVFPQKYFLDPRREGMRLRLGLSGVSAMKGRHFWKGVGKTQLIVLETRNKNHTFLIFQGGSRESTPKCAIWTFLTDCFYFSSWNLEVYALIPYYQTEQRLMDRNETLNGVRSAILSNTACVL